MSVTAEEFRKMSHVWLTTERGRMVGSTPNVQSLPRPPSIQNIPLRTEAGRALRNAWMVDYMRKVGVGAVDYADLERRFNLTEWQCNNCAHVNEKFEVVCSDCKELRGSE